jgi:hypothetical protein
MKIARKLLLLQNTLSKKYQAFKFSKFLNHAYKIFVYGKRLPLFYDQNT